MTREVSNNMETSAEWWDELTPRERVKYAKLHPHSKYAQSRIDATSQALQDHMRTVGWQRKGASWTHERSGRKIDLRKGSHVHNLVVTHANGDVQTLTTDSLRRAKRLVSDLSRSSGMARAKPASLKSNKGSLHAHLGIPQGRKIPAEKLARLADSDHPLASRARLALGLRKLSALTW